MASPPVWVLSCVFKLHDTKKLLWHFDQLNGFSPVNSYIWLLLEKLLSLFAQFNRFSPVWVISCVCKWSFLEKLLAHFEQLNGFCPVWVLSCAFKLLDLERLLSQIEHLNGFFSCVGSFMFLQVTLM